MEENMIGAAEINSIAYLNKKRKFQTELQETTLSKHVFWGLKLEHDSSSDSSTEPKKVRSIIYFARDESIPENANDSYSFRSNPNPVISYLSSRPETCTSVEASTSFGSRNGNSYGIGLYSLESRSLTKASSIKSESLSICEEDDRDYALHPFDIYEDHFLEFGNHADCSRSEYERDNLLGAGTQQGSTKPTIDKEFEEYFSMLML